MSTWKSTTERRRSLSKQDDREGEARDVFLALPHDLWVVLYSFANAVNADVYTVLTNALSAHVYAMMEGMPEDAREIFVTEVKTILNLEDEDDEV